MKADEIPVGEGRALTVGDQQVAVFRLRDGTFRALGAVCPHRGGPLADGLLDERVVVCPLHGLVYDLQSGAEVSSGSESAQPYTATVDRDGELCIAPASSRPV
jgi:nitrite reductase (NADH) small subunit